MSTQPIITLNMKKTYDIKGIEQNKTKKNQKRGIERNRRKLQINN